VDWPDLLGGAAGVVIEKAAFPNLDPKKPDLKDAVHDTLPFSGGPWVLASWSESRAVFSRNDRYWGQRSHLSSVTFVPLDNADQGQALRNGDIDAIFPDPTYV